jgi:CubicO group peptidase (beta-lactamase class C family)
MNFISNKAITLLLLSFFSTACVNANSSVNAYTSETQKINEIVTSAQQLMNFNGTVLVANSNDIIYHQSFGYADKDKNTPLTVRHQFAPGSVIKEFSTIAIMKLVAQGKIKYQDKITQYLTGLPEWASNVTIEHIMTHTSGLQEIKYQRGMSTSDVMKQIKAIKKLKYQPGKDFSYGNYNTVLRAVIVEKVTGKNFNQYIQDTLFTPSNMKDTFGRDNFDSVDPLITCGSKPLAISGVTAYSTALDLYRWDKAIWNNSLVNKTDIVDAIVKTGLSGSSRRAYFDFGFFSKTDKGTLKAVWHDGTYPSHYTLKSINFDKDLFIVLLSSDGRRSTLSELRESILNVFDKKSFQLPSVWWLTNEVKQKGVSTAINTFKSRIAKKELIANESNLNLLGYDFDSQKNEEAALAIMKLNLELFPKSENTHDSYAELLIKAGKLKEAYPIIENGLRLATKNDNTFLIKRFKRFLQEINDSKAR